MSPFRSSTDFQSFNEPAAPAKPRQAAPAPTPGAAAASHVSTGSWWHRLRHGGQADALAMTSGGDTRVSSTSTERGPID